MAELPANMRDAWSRAGEEGKRQIEKDATALKRINERSIQDTRQAAKAVASREGPGVGQSLE